jgi:hypothetical protein
MSADEIQIKLSAQIDSLISGFNDAADAVNTSLTEIQTQVSALSGSLDSKLSEGPSSTSSIDVEMPVLFVVSARSQRSAPPDLLDHFSASSPMVLRQFSETGADFPPPVAADAGS